MTTTNGNDSNNDTNNDNNVNHNSVGRSEARQVHAHEQRGDVVADLRSRWLL